MLTRFHPASARDADVASGITLTKGYEDLHESGEEFEGKTVAVIGMGNAAMETVNALSPYANFVHLYASRRSQRGHFVSWESRYAQQSLRSAHTRPRPFPFSVLARSASSQTMPGGATVGVPTALSTARVLQRFDSTCTLI